MRKIESSQEFDETIKTGNVVIADFYADWCGPCQVQSPILEELSKELDGKVDVIKINVDQQQELAQRFGVRSIPTLVFFKDQKTVDTLVGLSSKEVLKKRVFTLEVS